MGDIYGYEVEGIAQTDQQMTEWLANNKPSWGSDWAAGDVMYKDLNGDKKVNSGKGTYDDMGDLRKIGNSLPRYRYGITLDAAWKGSTSSSSCKVLVSATSGILHLIVLEPMWGCGRVLLSRIT